jgi:hypothetical protein
VIEVILLMLQGKTVKGVYVKIVKIVKGVYAKIVKKIYEILFNV